MSGDGRRFGRRPGHVVVVGASIAGISAVDALRAEGFDGRIMLIGAEPHGPYARPPLSKGVLDGSLAPESTLLPVPEAGVELRTGVAATGLDQDRRVVTLDDGDRVHYDGLMIATGSRARRLEEGVTSGGPAAELVLRSLDDAVQLRDRLAGARSVVVVGGGFLGMEVASSARGLGLDVTVIDLRPPLVAVLGPFLAGLFARAAQERGVRIVVGHAKVRLLRDGDRTIGAEVDGRRVEADVVVTAVGDRPNVEWLAGSGIATVGGVTVDDRCRANGDVVAAGDVAAIRAGASTRRMPFWSNAIAQAQCAAKALLRGGDPVLLAGSVTGPPGERSALLHWVDGDHRAAAAVNHKVSQAKLRRLAAELPAGEPLHRSS